MQKTVYSKLQKGIPLQLKVHKNKVTYKISIQYLKACRRKLRKTSGPGGQDGDANGRHVLSKEERMKIHTILEGPKVSNKRNCDK